MNARVPGEPRGNRLFWSGVVIGWTLIVIGIRGVIVDGSFTRPPQWSAWFIGAAVFHDLIVAPIVFALAATFLRRLRPPYRAPVQAAVGVTALIVAGSLPVVLRLGEPTGNPTVLPENALPAFVAVIGAIWGATMIVMIAAWRRDHRTGAHA